MFVVLRTARCGGLTLIAPARGAFRQVRLGRGFFGHMVCRVIAHMDRGGFASCVPVRDASVGERSLIDF